MSTKLAQGLEKILLKTRDAAGKTFSGTGLIVSDSPEFLPVLPLRSNTLPPVKGDAVTILSSISTVESEYHDGFHILNSAFSVTHVALYFSPPIVTTTVVDRSKRFGGRYLAALFGSNLPGVLMTGIVSNGFGLAVFRDGLEEIFEPLQ